MTETIQPQAWKTQRSADSQLKRNWAKLRRNKAALFGGSLDPDLRHHRTAGSSYLSGQPISSKPHQVA